MKLFDWIIKEKAWGKKINCKTLRLKGSWIMPIKEFGMGMVDARHALEGKIYRDVFINGQEGDWEYYKESADE